MTEHAFAILDAAVRDARMEPIALTPAIRLALCWLTVQGLTDSWHVDKFWRNLTCSVEDTEFQEPYCRRRDMHIALEAWRTRAREKGILPKL